MVHRHTRVSQNSKFRFRQVWSEYARSNDKHVALIDRMGRDACKDRFIYRLFIEGIDKSIIYMMNANPVYSMYVSSVERSADAKVTVDADYHARCIFITVSRV
jgi:hypothetical protein